MNNSVAKIYKRNNDIWGLPQEYKNIKFSPVMIKDVEYLDLLYMLFGQPKNYIPDRQIIKMSYLMFLLYIVFASDPNSKRDPEDVGKDLIKFFKYITKTEDVELGQIINPEAKDPINRKKLCIRIDDVEFSENEFDNIREIILEQNGIGIKYIDDYNPELEAKMIGINANKTGKIALHDEVFTLCALLGQSVFEIGKYSLFQFKMQVEKSFALNSFEVYKPMEAWAEIKGGVDHFLFHSENKGRYDSILISKNEYMKSDIFKASA